MLPNSYYFLDDCYFLGETPQGEQKLYSISIPSKLDGNGRDAVEIPAFESQGKIFEDLVEKTQCYPKPEFDWGKVQVSFGSSEANRNLFFSEIKKYYLDLLTEEQNQNPAAFLKYFPGADQQGASTQHLKTAEMQSLAINGKPLLEDELNLLCQKHSHFLDVMRKTQKWGKWEVLEHDGFVFHIYNPPSNLTPFTVVGRSLSEMSANGIDLTFACLSRAHFQGVNFTDSDFSFSVNTDSVFDRCIFDGVTLTRADFSRSTFSHCTFHLCFFSDTDFENCFFEDCSFLGTNMSLAKYPGARFANIALIDGTVKLHYMGPH